jgi:hypothetical protein
VKVAVTSSSFAALLRRGEMTHLEWLEQCASRLDVDGVVFALSDFPRTDIEYAAQLKKVATDLGIVPVALEVPGLLDPECSEADGPGAIALAVAIGAGLIRVTAGAPGELPPEMFARTVAATKTLTSAAKAANVTLAVAPAEGTLFAGLADVQKFSKYVDSAWLRYDLPAGSPERAHLGARDRVLVERFGFAEDPQLLAQGPRRGWLVLEGNAGNDPFDRAATVIAAVRNLGQRPQMPSVVPG